MQRDTKVNKESLSNNLQVDTLKSNYENDYQ